jgi:hypothetical protein
MSGPGVDLYHQFILSDEPVAVEGEWVSHLLGGFHLHSHSTLPVVRILDSNGLHIGFVLGWPIDPTGKIVGTDLELGFEIGGSRGIDSRGNRESDLEEYVYNFGGRFAFIFLTRGLKRLYLDAVGSLAAVYCHRRKRVASTLTLLVQDEQEHPIFSRSIDEFPGDRINQYWPGGLTPDPVIRRVLPNHFLDLTGWNSVRHYPNSAVEPYSAEDMPGQIHEITRIVRRNLLAIVEHSSNTQIAITAGYDTRLLLACAKDFFDHIQYFTFDYRGTRSFRDHFADLHVGKLLAEAYGLRHKVIPVEEEVPREVEVDYMLRTGFSGHPGKAKDFYLACKQNLDLSGALVTGFAPASHPTPPPLDATHGITPSGLLRWMRLPETDHMQEAMQDWLSGLEEWPIHTKLDLAVHENRRAAWASAHAYGAAPFSMNVFALNHRAIYDISLRVPAEYRVEKKKMQWYCIKRAWPELLSAPINRYAGPISWYWQARRHLKRVRAKLKAFANRL